MILIKDKISQKKLKDLALETFGNLVKAVVDLKKGVMVLGAEMHSDEEAFLLENGSKQKDLWGINIYPDAKKGEMVEFDSMINIRPSQKNLSRSIEDVHIRKEISKLVANLVEM